MARLLKDVTEFRLVEMARRSFASRDRSVIVSIGDDAAVVRHSPDKYLLYTADMLVEGVHFRKQEDPVKVGYKAMAVSVSDIAAMGGVPRFALVSVGLPKKNTLKVAGGLFRGIRHCAEAFDIHVIGGDTNRSPHLVIDVCMIGEVRPRHLVLRSGARAGDFIFVSGPLGGSLKGRHLNFKPRLKESRFLVKNFHVTAMIDISDGLAMDLARLSLASRVGALIFESQIPKSRGSKSVRPALYDGEDFELLFTLAPAEARRLLSVRKPRFCFIGRMSDEFGGVRMVRRDGRLEDVRCAGYQHF